MGRCDEKKRCERRWNPKENKNANMAFPDAMVENYESLIESLQLPDLQDRHVLAVAIKSMPM